MEGYEHSSLMYMTLKIRFQGVVALFLFLYFQLRDFGLVDAITKKPEFATHFEQFETISLA
jgi:hypothetical protein